MKSPNDSLEANCRGVHPLDADRQFGDPLRAWHPLFPAVAQFNRYAA